MTPEHLRLFLDRPIAFHRIFATIAGNACNGLFLSQLYYWSLRTVDPDGWVYKTQEQWQDETALTRYEQETARKALTQIGILEQQRKGVPSRLYYRLNVAIFVSYINYVAERVSAGSTMGEIHKLLWGKPTDKDGGNPQTGVIESTNHASGIPPFLYNTETTAQTTAETTSTEGAKSRPEYSARPIDIALKSATMSVGTDKPNISPSHNARSSTTNRTNAGKPVALEAPDQMPVTEGMWEWAQMKGWRGSRELLQETTEAFLDYHTAKGNTFVDWLRAWQTWVRNSIKFGDDLPRSTSQQNMKGGAEHGSSGSNGTGPKPGASGAGSAGGTRASRIAETGQGLAAFQEQRRLASGQDGGPGEDDIRE